ncbi:uncharacterized protein OCT59_026104 [Rhizophagus irregularis]|nr:hypothetical protein OCT59_026104 [Rhizophagus irregularis]GET50429.1 hypothetical protein GLOIN_2v1488754 [Rhizophagus irregularis DAOM 181602=DAOM 197198]
MSLLMYQNKNEPAFPSVQEFKMMNSFSLCEFLKNKYKQQEEFFNHFEILRHEMIDGENFMLLNKPNLEDSPFIFPAGDRRFDQKT